MHASLMRGDGISREKATTVQPWIYIYLTEEAMLCRTVTVITRATVYRYTKLWYSGVYRLIYIY